MRLRGPRSADGKPNAERPVQLRLREQDVRARRQPRVVCPVEVIKLLFRLYVREAGGGEAEDAQREGGLGDEREVL